MRFIGRIVLSSLLLVGALAACDAPDSNPGIGTSPSGPTADDQPEQLDQVELPVTVVQDCGLWIAPTYELAVARYDANPAHPDMRQYALPGGLSCAALLAAAPAVEANWGGVAVVRYIALAKPSMLLRQVAPAGHGPAFGAPAPQTAGFDLWQILVDRGGDALKAALALLATAAAWLLARAGLSAKWRSLIEELGALAKDIVLEVFQTYVEAIKAGRADGKLTDNEKAAAKALAIAKLKERLSWSKLLQLGGGWLAKLFGGDEWEKKVEGWLSGAVETAVAEAKRDGKAQGLVTSGKDAPNSIVGKLPLQAPPLPR